MARAEGRCARAKVGGWRQHLGGQREAHFVECVYP